MEFAESDLIPMTLLFGIYECSLLTDVKLTDLLWKIIYEDLNTSEFTQFVLKCLQQAAQDLGRARFLKEIGPSAGFLNVVLAVSECEDPEAIKEYLSGNVLNSEAVWDYPHLVIPLFGFQIVTLVTKRSRDWVYQRPLVHINTGGRMHFHSFVHGCFTDAKHYTAFGVSATVEQLMENKRDLKVRLDGHA